MVTRSDIDNMLTTVAKKATAAATVARPEVFANALRDGACVKGRFPTAGPVPGVVRTGPNDSGVTRVS